MTVVDSAKQVLKNLSISETGKQIFEDLDPDEDKDVRAKIRRRIKEQALLEARNMELDKKVRAKQLVDAAKRRKDDEATAKTLQAQSPYQLEVEPRLTGRTTTMLAAAIKGAGTTSGLTIKWVCVQKHHARDVMTRAYPLALQLAYIAVPEDRTYSLKFATGSRIEFVWPGKVA